MFLRLHHIGIAVRNLDEMIQRYCNVLGIEPSSRIERPGLKAALIPIGDVLIELIEPSKELKDTVNETLTNLVMTQGGGVHHLAFEVDDIHKELKTLKAKGVKLINDTPLKQEGGEIVWLQGDTVEGIMIELCNKEYRVT